MQHFWKSGLAASAVLAGAGAIAQADILPGNFFANPTLETPSVTQDNCPAGWRRGGVDFQDPPNAGPYTSAFWDNLGGTVDGTHALRLSDSSAGSNGEWLTPWFGPDPNITQIPAGPGNFLLFHFHRKFETGSLNADPPDMRVTIRGHDGISDFGLGNNFDFIMNGSTGGAFESVTFERQIPAGLTGFMIIIASGGGGGVTGSAVIDEISVARVPEPASATLLIGAMGLVARRRFRR